MFATPSKLGHQGQDPPTHLIINQGGSSSDESERRTHQNQAISGLADLDTHDDDHGSDSSGSGLRVPVLNFGANISETHAEMQTQIVNSFRKVLSVLRQYAFLFSF
jgi:hypothetical protein